MKGSGKKVLVGFSTEKLDVPKLLYGLKERGHEVVYCITDEDTDWGIGGTTFHYNKDARIGTPAHIHKKAVFPVPEKSLIEKLYKTESIVLTIMNRKVDDEDETRVGMDEKKHLYYDMVRYWSGILELYRPEVICLPAVPHSTYNYILYALAKVKAIPVVLLRETFISDRVLIQYDYTQPAPALTKLLASDKNTYSVEDLDEDIKEYYLSHIDEKQDGTPLDVHIMKRDFTLFKFVTYKIQAFVFAIRHGQFFKRLGDYMRRFFGENVAKEYTALVQKSDFKKPYVYVALHWQPECSTAPLGELFVDQLLMVETLSQALPDGWKLYVKEHPFQWHIRGRTRYSTVRYKGYYQKMAALPNVELMPIGCDTFALMQNAQAVASVTGRASIEAALRKIPTLVFGYAWFVEIPGAYFVDGLSSCKDALLKIQNGKTISEQSIVRYLKLFGDSSKRMYLNYWGKTQSKLSIEDNEESILNTLDYEIRHAGE